MQSGKLLGLILIALLTLSIFPSLTVYAAGSQQLQDQTKAEEFIEIAQRAHDQAVKLRDLAGNGGVNITASNVLISEGETLLNNAKASLNDGDYTTAFEKAREAQAKFRDAVKALGVSPSEDEEEKGEGILVAISRAEETIQRLREVVKNINVTQENQKHID